MSQAAQDGRPPGERRKPPRGRGCTTVPPIVLTEAGANPAGAGIDLSAHPVQATGRRKPRSGGDQPLPAPMRAAPPEQNPALAGVNPEA